jgi:hypothetical protein
LFLECLETRFVPGFLAPLTYDVGTVPLRVAVGDFNGDGIPDLVTANVGSDPDPGSVSVLLGNGDGTFQPARNFLAGSNPWGVAVGDFNGDGIPDLAVANSAGFGGASGVSVLLGNGDGTFQSPRLFRAGSLSTSVTVADFNGDGLLDLAVTNDGSNFLSVLLGNGDGTFQPARNFTIGGEALSAAVGDFNGDGIPDLAVARTHGSYVSVLLGYGDGSFQPARAFFAGSNPQDVAVGDFNGDGIPDLAVANYLSDGVSVLLGNGDGTFQPARTVTTGAGASVAVADFNGDGIADLAVANFFSDSVRVLLGNGDGTFLAPRNFPAGQSPRYMAVGDFNGDGSPDLAVANEYSNRVSILLNDGNWGGGGAPGRGPGSPPRRPLPAPLVRGDRALVSLVAAKIVFSPAESAHPAPAAAVSPMGSLPPELAVSSLDPFFAATPAEPQCNAFSRSKVLTRGWMDDWLTVSGLFLDSIGIGTIGNDDGIPQRNGR